MSRPHLHPGEPPRGAARRAGSVRPQSGFSLVEVLVALAILTTCMLAAARFISGAQHSVKHDSDKDFAIQKAISMLEELKSVAEGEESDATVLDDYDDGTGVSAILTTDWTVTDPAAPQSGNQAIGDGWRFERRVSVRKFESVQSNDIRVVNVAVWGLAGGERTRLAEVGGVIRTIADRFPPTQVYDVYCLAIENVPGWWVYMANLVPFVQNAISDLQSRNPGLEFRTHWITKLSYGRDREYTPFVNEGQDSTQLIDWAYFYPGTLPAGSAVSQYYVPKAFKAQVSIDGIVHNGFDADSNPVPYALADTYNHALRLPDERALFEARVEAGLDRPDEPTWRLLLEDMTNDPDKYRNALVINLHGELFPFPPIRNYSDPAKDPEGHPGARVVTHPENLRSRNTDALILRVHSFLTEPDLGGTPDRLDVPISVLVRGVSDATGVSVKGIEGGFDLNPINGTRDTYIAEVNDGSLSHAGDMYRQSYVTDEGLLLILYNSPLKTPCPDGSCNKGGLPASRRLYDLEYIPTPITTGSGGAFSRDLVTTGTNTKHTARWVITIPATNLPADAMVTVETRIGDDLETGVLYPTAHQPANLSRTYAWRGTDTWIFGDGSAEHRPHLPVTERYQIVGDPRHVPYADIKADYHATTNPLGMGYNRYFDDFHDSAGNRATNAAYWTGFSGVKSDSNNANDGWEPGSRSLEIEVNRLFQVTRGALLKSSAIYTTLTGFSYYYVGLGNEIGYDSANGFPSSIPVSRKPFDGAAGARNEMSITDAESGGVKYIAENSTSGSAWWGLNWIGELYPDSEYETWRDYGNLPSGSGPGTYVRKLRDAITTHLPSGTTFTRSVRRTGEPGSTTFFSVGTPSSKFHHVYADGGSGTLQAAGNEIKSRYNFALPDTVAINRPFNISLNGDGRVPDHYLQPTYVPAALAASTLAPYFDHSRSGVLGSALLGLGGSGEDMAYVAVNGISMTQETGSAFMGRWAFLTLIQSYLEGGLAADMPRIVQVPRIAITEPNDLTDLDNPDSVQVAWDVGWTRWDGLTYTAGYEEDFEEDVELTHVVLYSEDNGASWRHAVDGSPALPGTRPADEYVTTTDTEFGWPVPEDSFPQGSYLVRVESFRDGFVLHHSYHQCKIFIKRW